MKKSLETQPDLLEPDLFSTVMEVSLPKRKAREEASEIPFRPESKTPEPTPSPEPEPMAKAPQVPSFPTPSDPLRHLVVSIHDVSPLTREVTEQILAELKTLGISRVSLLVIPDHHHKGHVLDHPEFCAWLRECVEAGHEVALHGYYHRRDQRAGESFKEKLTTKYYTAGEGEFFDIAGADALRLVSQARQELRKVGLDPQGFVAPAWLLSEGADRALQRLGIAYTTRIGGIFDYTTGIHHTSQSLVWSTRSWWRRILSRMWNAHLFRRLKPCVLMRIGIHPSDLNHPAIWRQIKALTNQALKERVPVTYAGYLKKS